MPRLHGDGEPGVAGHHGERTRVRGDQHHGKLPVLLYPPAVWERELEEAAQLMPYRYGGAGAAGKVIGASRVER
ncbi:MAG: hypothetical protein FJX77_07790 [Armatimonadetes bacterium]|nr:hypothetical protein [Armatimonadota bacterium]MBM3947057.1 hypothetical protein [SAR202 cluster bacterium]